MLKSMISSTGKIRPALPVFVHTDMLARKRPVYSFTNNSVSFQVIGGMLCTYTDIHAPWLATLRPLSRRIL